MNLRVAISLVIGIILFIIALVLFILQLGTPVLF